MMKKSRTIHNLDSLEKEIYRLQVEAMNKEKKISENVECLRENTKGATHFFKSETVNRFVTALADRVANRAVNSIDGFISNLFHRRPGR